MLRAVGRHRHIVSLIESFELASAWGVVLDLVSGGEVFERICEKGAYSEKDAAALVRQVARALEHIHASKVVHRDLKPENLLLTDMSDAAVVKVCDFGLSSFDDGKPFQEAVGTVRPAPRLRVPQHAPCRRAHRGSSRARHGRLRTWRPR